MTMRVAFRTETALQEAREREVELLAGQPVGTHGRRLRVLASRVLEVGQIHEQN